MSVLLSLVLAGTPIAKSCSAPDDGLGEIVLGLGTQKVLSVDGPVSDLRVINADDVGRVIEVKVVRDLSRRAPSASACCRNRRSGEAR